jgi:hypothetical protein
MRKQMKRLVLMAIVVTAAMTSLPESSYAGGPKICDYEYYYDAAHTQPAGYCNAACYAGGNVCYGEVTGYYVLVNCRPACMPDDW